MQIGTLETGWIGPGVYDIPEDVYHEDSLPPVPTLSSSVASILINATPRHAYFEHPRLNPTWERKDEDKFSLGKAFHKLVLGKGQDIAILRYPDWRTKDAKEAKADAIRAHLIPMLEKNYEQAEAMAQAVGAQIRGFENLAYAMAGGVAERAYYWEEQTPYGPVICRCLTDWTPHGGPELVDWKSTAALAGPDEWGQRVMWEIGADIQDAFYRRGHLMTTGREFTNMLFAVAETSAPHCMMTHRVGPATQALAARGVQQAINTFGLCLSRNYWPGWPRETAWQEIPGWRENKRLSREESGAFDPEAMEARIAAIKSMGDVEKRPGMIDDQTARDFGLDGEDG